MKIKLTEEQYSKLKQRLTEDVSIESLTQNINQLISKVNGMYNIIISSTLDELLDYDLIEKYRNELDNIDSMGSKIESKINDLLGDDWQDMPDNVHLLYKKSYTLNNMLYDIRRIVDRDEETEDYKIANLFSDIKTTNI
jgi:DNA-binding beta-propeller fold protein YncE